MRHTALVFLALVAAGSTTLTPEQQIVDDAARAMGGAEKIRAVKTLVIEGDGVNGNLGQDLTPEAASQTFALSGYRRAIDLEQGRTHIEQTRTPNFTYFQGQAPQKQILGLDKDVAYNIAPNGNATRVAEAAASDRKAELYHHPLAAVRAALDPAAKLTNPHAANGQQVVDVLTPTNVNFTLAIDDQTKLPTRVVTMTDNPNLGDVAIETSFTNYADAGGLKLPTRLVTTTDGVMTATINASRQTVDGDTGDLAAPAAAANAAPITGPPAVTVTVEEIAKGVWLLAGQSHHSVVIELTDHLLLVEAPQSEPRALAVIAKARELRPGKPLTDVVATHHHFDHSAGIRAAVSEGLAIITDRAAAQYYQTAATRRHTIVPDALMRTPKSIVIRPVDDEMVIKDKMHDVHIYHVSGSNHADTMLVVHLPKEKMLIEADLYTPGAAVNAFASSLLNTVQMRKLKVDRIVPIHGQIAKYGDFEKAMKAN